MVFKIIILASNCSYYETFLLNALLDFWPRKFCLISDLTESSIPKWMFETGAVFLHGYDKEGNKLCMLINDAHTAPYV